MDRKVIEELIREGRNFMKMEETQDEDYVTDQYLKKQQPPLVKAPMTVGPYIDLPTNYRDLGLKQDFYEILLNRQSHRVYDREAQMSLLQLSWMLWASQGIKGIRGKRYATLRTVASGGARHPFEVYMIIERVESLQDGFYHYLPMHHQLEYLGNVETVVTEQPDVTLRQWKNDAVYGQNWAGYGNVLFVYSMDAYRAEWRYGIFAHRPALMDAGHVTENLYLACTAAGLGTCAIAAVDGHLCDSIFGLDGIDEFCFYAAAAGCIKQEDEEKENELYAFVKEEGL